MAKWKNYKPDELIKRIESKKTINTEGRVQYSGFDMLSIPSKLAAMISFKKDISLSAQTSTVKQAIFDVGEKALTAESLLEMVNNKEKELLSTREKNYVLATNISVDKAFHSIPSMAINSNKFTFTKNLPASFGNAIKNSNRIQSFYERRGIPGNYLNVRVSVKAKTLGNAAEKAMTSLNLFRGLVNFLINFGNTTFRLGGNGNGIEAVNKVLLGPISTIHTPDGKMVDDNLLWYEEEYRKSSKAYRQPDIARFDRMLNSAKDIRLILNKSKISNTLVDAFLLYNDALDTCNYEMSYIKLWAVLELLTGKEPNERQDKVVKRTTFIFRETHEVENDIRLLKDYRNNLAHKGFMNVELERFVYELKLYVERLLKFLINNSLSFQDYDDVRFLLDSSWDISDLNRKLKLTKLAQKINRTRNQ